MILLQMPRFARNNHVELTLMDKVIEEADFISLHLPLLPETRGLVNDALPEQDEKRFVPDQHLAWRSGG